jgi:hypothetical protein
VVHPPRTSEARGVGMRVPMAFEVTTSIRGILLVSVILLWRGCSTQDLPPSAFISLKGTV